MKIYILMTSLMLTAGAALGYWTGQGSAQTGFASGCSETGIVVVYDYNAEEHRHFHCFELKQPQQSEPRKKPDAGKFVVL
jgi:hypothetical protein